jgi:hypothetical protein
MATHHFATLTVTMAYLTIVNIKLNEYRITLISSPCPPEDNVIHWILSHVHFMYGSSGACAKGHLRSPGANLPEI